MKDWTSQTSSERDSDAAACVSPSKTTNMKKPNISAWLEPGLIGRNKSTNEGSCKPYTLRNFPGKSGRQPCLRRMSHQSQGSIKSLNSCRRSNQIRVGVHCDVRPQHPPFTSRKIITHDASPAARGCLRGLSKCANWARRPAELPTLQVPSQTG